MSGKPHSFTGPGTLGFRCAPRCAESFFRKWRGYLCPAGQQLNYGGRNDRNRAFAYIGTRPKCGPCPLKSQCTRGAFRFLDIHMNEAARQRSRDLWNTPEVRTDTTAAEEVKALFAELKGCIGLQRLCLRRLKFVQGHFFLAATAEH